MLSAAYGGQSTGLGMQNASIYSKGGGCNPCKNAVTMLHGVYKRCWMMLAKICAQIQKISVLVEWELL